ncbi:MAG: GGDEF domain-containing protein [Bacillota bacterium]|nr:GGDEF domain-containing protein [Bacillota bacterium]
MNKFFLKFSPYIIITSVLLLHVIGYLLDVSLHGRFIIFIWSAIAIIDMLFGFFCGKAIQGLHKGTLNDTLTGLGNRSLFYLELSNRMNNSCKNEFPISLLMLDIDNFKTINDTYGHAVGDNVLVELADILKNNTRSTDTVVRWGGEEFTIILPRTTAKEAVLIAERIRKTIESYMFYCGEISIKATVSIGVSMCSDKVDMDKVVSMADKALYKAKESKNLVIAWTELPSYELQVN